MNKYNYILNKLKSNGLFLITKENEFKGTNALSVLKCSYGHQWLAKITNILEPLRIKRESKGCPECAKNLYIKQSYDIAISKKPKNHKIVSSYLKPIKHKKNKNLRIYTLECEFGHNYDKPNSRVSDGCPECSKKTYVGQERVRVMFETEFNKKFPTIRPDWLKNPETGRNLELDGYCEELKLAFEYQGRQHNSNDTEFGGDYENQKVRDQFKFQTCLEHGIKLINIIQPRSYEQEKFFASIVTQAALQQVVFKSVLDEIDFSSINDTNSLKKIYDLFNNYVREKGYTLLSKTVTTMDDELYFKCKNGHNFNMKGSMFKTMLNTKKYRDEPCLECHKINNPEKLKEIVTLKVCQDFATSINYKCLSNTYINVNTLMNWECNNGHKFSKNYRSFQRNKTAQYCSECQKNNLYEKMIKVNPNQYKSFEKSIISRDKNGEIKDLEWLKSFSKKNDLELISDKYLGMDYTHSFKCNHNHNFETTISNLKGKIKRKSILCPHIECNFKNIIDLNYCKKFALNNNIECLSDTYINVNTLMDWKCINHHIFKKSFRQFQRNKTGKYCPKCKN